MSIIATAVKHLMAAGVTGDALIEAIAELEAAQPRDAAADRRRERDREYQAAKRASRRQISADSADYADASPSLSPSPKEKISNPHPHTHPETQTRAREAGSFPCPEWCDPAVWRDLRKNRRTKKLTDTATAHRQFVAAIEAMADDAWPPGKLVEAIAAKGWGGPHDPREDRKPANDRPRSPNDRPTTRQIGERVAARLAAGGGGPAYGLPQLGSSGGYG